MASKGDYEVGYGRPPKHTRFKKGQSGNPSGKPKKGQSDREIVEREGRRKVTIREDGKARRISLQELMWKSTWAKAAKGDLKSISLIREVRRNAPDASVADGEDPPMRITLVFEEEELRRQQRLEEENREEDSDEE